MSVACAPPNADAGVGLLLSDYLDCHARALGENGFQALAGGALGTAILSGLLTIFIGLVGYRFILGETPGLREGAGWTVRVGLVLALVTGWAAFRTLVYDVAVEGPRELAGIVLPASGLPAEGLDGRVQRAYDTIRLGSADPVDTPLPTAADPEGENLAQRYQFQPPLPRTASLFVISTSGFTGALRIGVGFLLAIAPLAIMCLLFDATLGLFSGWVRAVSGLALATLAATLTTALALVLVEAEIDRIQALRAAGTVQSIDPQALSVIVILFALIMLVTVVAALRTTSAFLLRGRSVTAVQEARRRREPLPRFHLAASAAGSTVAAPATAVGPAAAAPLPSRVSSVAGALSSTVRREQLQAAAGGGSGAAPSYRAVPNDAGEAAGPRPAAAMRRGLGRRTRQGAARDRSS